MFFQVLLSANIFAKRSVFVLTRSLSRDQLFFKKAYFEASFHVFLRKPLVQGVKKSANRSLREFL